MSGDGPSTALDIHSELTVYGRRAVHAFKLRVEAKTGPSADFLRILRDLRDLKRSSEEVICEGQAQGPGSPRVPGHL